MQLEKINIAEQIKVSGLSSEQRHNNLIFAEKINDAIDCLAHHQGALKGNPVKEVVKETKEESDGLPKTQTEPAKMEIKEPKPKNKATNTRKVKKDKK